MAEWLTLIYKVPPEPSKYRAGIWRKLKGAGAIYLQNGVAALPATPKAERLLRGIAHDIRAISGVAYVLQGNVVGEEASLIEAFNAARDEEYREVLSRCHDFHEELQTERARQNFTFAELEENEEDLTKLEGWLAKVKDRDHFRASLTEEAGKEVAACREDLDRFAGAVYQAVDHGSAGPGEGKD